MSFFTADLKIGAQCCDCWAYIEQARDCAENLNCWNALRPMGAKLYMAIPMFAGKTIDELPELNMLVLFISVILSVLAVGKLMALPEKLRVYLPLLAASFLAHMLFLGPYVYVTTEDFPAGASALIGIWLILLFSRRGSLLLAAGAGLALGGAAFIRSFYLYPALATAAILGLLMVLFARKHFLPYLVFALALCTPIATQFYFTHENTGNWSYLEQKFQQKLTGQHLNCHYYGWDTYITEEGKIVPKAWIPRQHVKAAEPAWRDGDWKSFGKLALLRGWYYFGSYISDAYATGRIFSRWILVFQLSALWLTLLFFMRPSTWYPTLAILGFCTSIAGVSLIICPESRFMLVPIIVNWVFAAGCLVNWATVLIPGYVSENRDSTLRK